MVTTATATYKLDVDGILRNFVDSFHRTYIKYYPEHEDQIKPVNGWGLDKVYPLGKKINDFMYEEHLEEVFLEADILPGAFEFVGKLREHGKIHIVTFQPVGKEIPTILWLQKYKIKYDAISIIFDKTQIDGTCLIDDGLHNLVAEAKSGKSVPVALACPWNTEWDGWRFDTYDEIVNFVSMINPNFSTKVIDISGI